MPVNNEALVRLLVDDDESTVRLVKEQLEQGGDQNLERLQELISCDDVRVSRHAREILMAIAARRADEDFSAILERLNKPTDLERALWFLSRTLLPDAPIDPCKRKINAWGREFQLRSAGAVSDREKVRLLAEFLSNELGFRGNTENYYSERNSLLGAVVDSRLGIPITLTMVYTMVGSRAGMVIDGINLPGHFIARHGDVFFDPFHKGKILSRGDCEEILTRQNLKLKSKHLEAATPRQVLTRVLANLLYVYDLEHDSCLHGRVDRWLQQLTGGPAKGGE